MNFDAIIVGAGASGLMCARKAAERGRRVVLIDHQRNFGQKILVSGGGRCNFSNLNMDSNSFISENRHFPKSALARFGPGDITDLLDRHGIGYHEKAQGQLFLTGSSRQLLDMFLRELKRCGITVTVGRISWVKRSKRFIVKGEFGAIEADKLVVATGGLSYPKLGASDFGLRMAGQFGHAIIPSRPALVPLVLSSKDRSIFSKLSGVSCRARVSCAGISLCDDLLFTHRGFSGPAILRISLYWTKGDKLTIDFFSDKGVFKELEKMRAEGSTMELETLLARHVPARLAATLCARYAPSRRMHSYSKKELRDIEIAFKSVVIVPQTTEGYGKAEVTVGGVDTRALSSKTMESKLCHGLYFIGEVLDVTGDLGGYNLHWAWASGCAAGKAI